MYYNLSTLDGRVFLYVHVTEKLHSAGIQTPEIFSTSFTFSSHCLNLHTLPNRSLHHVPFPEILHYPAQPNVSTFTCKPIKHYVSLIVYYYCCQLTNIWCFVDLYDFSQIKVSCNDSHLKVGKRGGRKGKGANTHMKNKRTWIKSNFILLSYTSNKCFTHLFVADV